MAYVIGSQKGKDKAKEMKDGEKWTASDGSTWEKKSDGSVSVTHNGQTYDNAYTPTSSGGSSGGGGGNSQYTKVNLGDTWNANTDYQAIINNAVKNGDYATAAKAEQLRNQKISATGSNYNTTNMYTGYLNTDYGTLGQQQMANGASWQDVLATYNARNQKAYTTEGLQKYANDEIQQAMWQYIADNMKESNQPEDFSYTEEKPTAPEQDPRINRLLNEILNRDDFSYDAMSDPLYQQYKQMYQREGDKAMRETLAEVASGAGGMNSYAITAAQQAYNNYNAQLNDKIPELYQLAYQMYLNDKESKVQDLGILQNMDATQYNRYRDTMADWYTDKNFAYQQYYDAVQQGNWNTNFDYNATLNNRDFAYNDMWTNKEFNYNDMWANKEYNDNRADIEYERDKYDEETAYNKILDLVGSGVSTIDPALIAQAGLNQTVVDQMVAEYQRQQALQGRSGGGGGGGRSGGGGGGSSSSSSDLGYTGGDDEDLDEGSGDDTEDTPVIVKNANGEDVDTSRWNGSGNYQSIDEACKALNMAKGKSEVLAYLKRTLEEGAIDIYSYMTLVNKYRG